MSAGLPEQVTGATTSDGGRTPTQTFAYNAKGLLISYNPGNGAWTLAYDVTGMNRLKSRTDADGATWHFCYDWAGRLWYSETPYQYQLDGNDNTCATPGSGSAPAYAVSFAHDYDGNVTTETHHHESGTVADVTKKYYDGDDRLVEVVEPKTGQDSTDVYGFAWATRYIYDLSQSGSTSPGPLATYTNTGGGKTSLAGYGNMVETQEYLPTNPVLTWSGNTLSSTTAQWTDTKANSFDTLDRPTDKFTTVYTAGNEATVDESLAYDKTPAMAQSNDLPIGHLSSDCTGTECKYFSYIDPRGLNTREDFSGSATPTRTKTYDSNGRLVTNTSSVGSETYSYNADSHLQKIAYGGGYISYGYYEDGMRAQLNASTLGNGAFTYSYRTDGLLKSETAALPLNGSGSISYQRTAAGRPTSRTDIESGDAPGQTTSYTYDSAHQLASETFPHGAFTSMQYSPEGELLSYNNGVGLLHLDYNSRGELLSGGGVGKNYYANGVLVVSCPAVSLACGPAQVGAQWDAVMGAVLMNVYGGSSTSTPPQCLPSCTTTILSQITYDTLGRNVTSENCTLLSTPGMPGCGGSTEWTNSTTKRTYDVENHVISANGSSSQQGNTGNADHADYQWGVNGHPVSISTSGTQGGSGNESLFWDGDSLLYTLAGSTLDDVKIGDLADFTPQDPGYKGITFYDRGPGGSVSYCHNATGEGGSGNIDPYASQGKWSGGIVNPCFPSVGGSGSMPSRIVWNGNWSGQSYGVQQVPVVGAGWIIGEMRGDGFSDGVDTVQGVRAYDPNAAQWTTPDAFAGNVHDPMSQKSYMWNGNNPVQYADPSGYLTLDQQADMFIFSVEFQGQSIQPKACTDFILDTYSKVLNIDLRQEVHNDVFSSHFFSYRTIGGGSGWTNGNFAGNVGNLHTFFGNTGQLHSISGNHGFQSGDILFLKDSKGTMDHVAMVGATDSNGGIESVVESHGAGDSTAEVTYAQFVANMQQQGVHIDSYGRDDADDSPGRAQTLFFDPNTGNPI